MFKKFFMMDNLWFSSKKFWIFIFLVLMLWRSWIIELFYICLFWVLRLFVLLYEVVRIFFFLMEYWLYLFIERLNMVISLFLLVDVDVVRCFWIFIIFLFKVWSRCDVFIFLVFIYEFDGFLKKWWLGVIFIILFFVWNMMRFCVGNSFFLNLVNVM